MENKIKIIFPFTPSWIDYPDCVNISIVINCIGCEHNCKDCHNPEFQNYNYTNDNVKEYNVDSFIDELQYVLNKNKTNKVCLEGGDFLFSKNIEFTKSLLFQNLDIDFCIYTGYDIDYVEFNNIVGFKFIKCGKYNSQLKQESEKTDDYIQFASSNQKLYGCEYNLLSKGGRYYF